MNSNNGPNKLRWVAIGLGLMVLWVAYLALFGPKTGSVNGLSVPGLVGTGLQAPADYAWPLRDLDDKPVDFAQFKGRPVVLNVWATWCPPCRAEMPALASLAANPRIKANGVAVVCVATDESADTLRQFVAGKSWGMTMLRATSIPSVFLTDGIPATFLIAPDGKVVASELGAARWDDPSVVGFLEKLAASPR